MTHLLRHCALARTLLYDRFCDVMDSHTYRNTRSVSVTSCPSNTAPCSELCQPRRLPRHVTSSRPGVRRCARDRTSRPAATSPRRRRPSRRRRSTCLSAACSVCPESGSQLTTNVTWQRCASWFLHWSLQHQHDIESRWKNACMYCTRFTVGITPSKCHMGW